VTTTADRRQPGAVGAASLDAMQTTTDPLDILKGM
jgi:hypothetical protein